MKLHQSKILENLSMFKTNFTHNQLMRDHDSMYMLWKCIEYFDPKYILEIGFYKGQTLGLIEEISSPDAKIVSVDINYQYLDTFLQLFPTSKSEFILADSKQLELTHPFDFINIDGDHLYNGVLTDLKKCLPLLHKNSILCMDDYKFFDGVNRVVKEHLLGQHDYIPFFCTQQQMFFHHISHSADEFLDKFLLDGATEFIEFSNIDFCGFTVCHGQIFNSAIATDVKIFQSILKFYNL
jgi:hypothetical protein